MSQSRQQAWGLRVGATAAIDGIAPELLLHGIPGLAIDDRVMLSGMAHTFVDDLTDIDRVCQQLVYVSSRERLSTGPLIVGWLSRFGRQAQPVGVLFHEPDIGVLQIERFSTLCSCRSTACGP